MIGVALLALAAMQNFEPSLPAFQFALARYRGAAEEHARCEDTGPAEVLMSLPRERAEILATYIWADRGQRRPAVAGWPAATIASAAVLHTRVAYAYSEVYGTERAHLDLARRFLDLLAPGDPQYRIVPIWHALRAAELQGRAEVLLLVEHVRAVPEEHRTHPLILLATASMNEMLAAPFIQPDIRRRLTGGLNLFRAAGAVPAQQRAYRDDAIRAYRKAIEADASEAEAYIRLAHLLIGDGRLDEAAALLDRARSLAQAPVLRYYAALVAGRWHERRGQMPEAERAYQSAAGMAPGAQTPALAHAHLLFRWGRAAEARTRLERALTRAPGTQPPADPWWDYVYGQYWRRSAYVGEMLKLVRRCAS